MTTLIPEENATAAATASTKKPKANKKARIAPRRADVTPAKVKSTHKATSAKKALKGRSKLDAAKPEVARDSSKTAIILDLLKRSGGATAKDLMKASGWLPHSVRGFLSGTVRKKMGLAVTSAKSENGERSYSLKT